MDSATPIGADERGFTLLEVLVAMAVVVGGLLALGYGIGLGLEAVQTSTMDTIAREKAREAMEDVFTARDTAAIQFSQICNIPPNNAPNPNNCLFVNGYTPMYTPDTTHGLVNTQDATNQGNIETYWTPGPDGILGTADDVSYNLTGFQRQIQVSCIGSSGNSCELAQVTVMILYNPGPWQPPPVTLVTIISPYV
jgi:prepilin-type N-terminal cleavage/methylation domain-containing protein